VPLARVDQQHLAGPNLACLHSVIELQPTARHDQRDGNGVAVLGDGLAWLEAQSDHAHGAAVRNLLEAERSWLLTADGA